MKKSTLPVLMVTIMALQFHLVNANPKTYLLKTKVDPRLEMMRRRAFGLGNDYQQGMVDEKSEENEDKNTERAADEKTEGNKGLKKEGTDSAPEGIANEKTEKPEFEKTEDIEDDKSKVTEKTKGAADKETKGAADENTKGAAEKKTKGAADEQTKGAADEETKGAADEKTKGAADEKTKGAAEKKTKGAADEKTGGTEDEKIEGSVNEKTEEAEDEKTEEAEDDKIERTVNVKIEGTKDEKTIEAKNEKSEKDEQVNTENQSGMIIMNNVKYKFMVTEVEKAEGTEVEKTEGTEDEKTEGTEDEKTEGTEDTNTEVTEDEKTDGTEDENTEGTDYDQTEGTKDENTEEIDDTNTEGTADKKSEGIVLRQTVEDTGCRSNRHCVRQNSRCYLGSDHDIGLCGCKNGLSNYPSCERHMPNDKKKCDEDCTQKDGYCSTEGVCMCSFGGLWPNSCCSGLCSTGQTCYKGRCECMYGELPNGDCTLCKDPCGAFSECDESRLDAKCKCKYGGNWPDCKDDKPESVEFDCTAQCGQGSTCRKDASNRIICTECGAGRRLLRKINRCKYPGQWQEWGSCSVTCGVGVQKRKQLCKRNPCFRKSAQKRDCQTGNKCYGEWEHWKDWTDCSRTCGVGYHKRVRECLSPAGCGAGDSSDIQQCMQKACTAELYGDWGPWSECSQCNAGLSTRKRSCLSDIPCKANLSEERSCAVCASWGQWSTCSRTCGNGDKQRYRSCPSTDGCGSEKTKDSLKCKLKECLPKFEIIHNNMQYRCMPKLGDWSWAVKECRNAGWSLAMPKDKSTLKQLRKLCELKKVSSSDKVWRKKEWNEYAYWIGAKFTRYRGGKYIFSYLDGSDVSYKLFYGEKSIRNYRQPQMCLQANDKLTNDHCSKKRKFVCQKPVQ